MISIYNGGSVATVTGFIESVSERKTKRNKSFVQFTLCKNGQSCSCFLWDSSLSKCKIEQNDVLEVKGQVKLYNGSKSLHVSGYKKVEPSEEIMDELMPHLPDEEIAAYKEEVNHLIADINNKNYKKLLVCAFKKYGKEIFQAPAASKVHEAYRNGLIKHTINVTYNAIGLTKNYSTIIDKDLVVTASLLHDIGKIKSYIFNKFTIEYTKAGSLMDHIAMGSEIISNLCKECDIKITDEEIMLLKHCILSHHGSVDKGWGSCVSPAIPEAIIIHAADMADTQMSIMTDEIDKLNAGEKSDTKNYFLKSFVYKKLGSE